jgi:hypothetical protein
MANKEVNRLSTCPICEDIFSDPRILPCGRKVCVECIERQLTGQQDLECELCDEIHEMPPNGFPYDLQLRPKSSLKTETSVEFQKLETELNSLDLINSADESKEYYNKIKSRVDLETSILIQTIQQLNLEFYNQIEQYKSEKDAETVNEALSTFYLHRQEQLKKLFSVDKEAKSSNKQVESRKILKKINLKTELMPNVLSGYFKIVRPNETNSILAHIDSRFYLNVKLFDNNGATLREHLNFLNGCEISEFNFVEFNSNFVFYVRKKEEYTKLSVNNHSITSHRSRVLFVVDSHFHYLNHVELKLDVEKIATNKKHVFLLNSANKLAIYSGDLTLFRSNFDYDIHPMVRFMDASEENLVFLHVESKKIRIVNIESGECELSVPCRASQLKMTSSGQLILMFEKRGAIFNFEIRTGKLGLLYANSADINSSVSLTRDKSDLVSFYDQNCFCFF